MSVLTMPKEYKYLVKRQEKMEVELDFLKKIVLADEEKFIRPSVLKKWEKISKDMDKGKGLFFDSVTDMKNWMKNLRAQ